MGRVVDNPDSHHYDQPQEHDPRSAVPEHQTPPYDGNLAGGGEQEIHYQNEPENDQQPPARYPAERTPPQSPHQNYSGRAQPVPFVPPPSASPLQHRTPKPGYAPASPEPYAPQSPYGGPQPYFPNQPAAYSSQEAQPVAYPPPPQEGKPVAYPPAQTQPVAYGPAAMMPMKPGGAPVGLPLGGQYPVNSEGWKTDLFSCMDDPENALVTACFPCVTFGQIAEIVDNGQTPCGTSGLLYGCIAFFIGVPCIMSCTYRTKLRNRYGLIESPAPDWVTHCFCEWCSLCQEYRELRARGMDPSIGWAGNVARAQNLQMQQGATTPPMNQTMMG